MTTVSVNTKDRQVIMD
jgi:hypothetical protein